MSLKFNSIITPDNFYQSRLYIMEQKTGSPESNLARMHALIFDQGSEKKGLGMTVYGPILGRFLYLIGLAFKSKDEHQRTLYINKKSFCNLTYRLAENYANSQGRLNPNLIQQEYDQPLTRAKKKELKKIYKAFHQVLPDLKGLNIGEISKNFLDALISRVWMNKLIEALK